MAKEVEPLRPIQKKWNHERKKSLWIGLGVAFFLILILIANTVLREWKCVPMGKDDVVVMAVFQTSDGMIHITYDDLYNLNYFSSSVEVGSDGNGYISTYRPILAKKTNIPHRIGTGGICFDPESAFAWFHVMVIALTPSSQARSSLCRSQSKSSAPSTERNAATFPCSTAWCTCSKLRHKLIRSELTDTSCLKYASIV